MQVHAKVTTYKGRTIRLRSRQLIFSEAQSMAFTGRFLIAPVNGEPAKWQEVTDLVFHTPETATAHALVQARRSIDSLQALIHA
jgi:hypothetical protein